MSNRKVLAIASSGGHWSELNMLLDMFNNEKLVTIGTITANNSIIGKYDYYIEDCNINEKYKCIKAFVTLFKTIVREKPTLLITTGAAPGLMGLLAAKCLGITTIWIDSIANANRVSLSAQLACRISDVTLTQWSHLKTNKIEYLGSIL